jgi:hypothetical protein
MIIHHGEHGEHGERFIDRFSVFSVTFVVELSTVRAQKKRPAGASTVPSASGGSDR